MTDNVPMEWVERGVEFLGAETDTNETEMTMVELSSTGSERNRPTEPSPDLRTSHLPGGP
jgi:hypothetical protein